jgi:RimJ/RimL family protein N-acetyltransferase
LRPDGLVLPEPWNADPLGIRDLGLDRLVSIAHPANVVSRRVMEKLGFSLLAERDAQPWGVSADSRTRSAPLTRLCA